MTPLELDSPECLKCPSIVSSPLAAPQGTEPFVESSSANGCLRVMAAQVGGEDAVERAVGQHRAQAHDQGGIPAGGVTGARSPVCSELTL